MAKRLHPTVESLRQGQTVYCVCIDYMKHMEEARIDTFFMHSHKTPLPPSHCCILEMPVTHLKNRFKEFPSMVGDFFYSKKKALTAFKKLSAEIKSRSRIKITKKIETTKGEFIELNTIC